METTGRMFTAGGRYRLIGDSVKQYAEKLREEMEGRRLRFTPIDWPAEIH
jgi:hypothetical protein